jgi:hypothetical protein
MLFDDRRFHSGGALIEQEPQGGGDFFDAI